MISSSPDNITGIILAGGKSSRLGLDKGLLHYQGMTLSERAVKTLSMLCDDILIVTSNNKYQQAQVRLIPDLIPDKGPMMGVYSGLMASTTLHNLVLAVDNCFVTHEFYRFVLNDTGDYHAIVPYFGPGHYEPLVGYYSKECLPLMSEFIKKDCFKLPDYLDQEHTKRIDLHAGFQDFTPEYFKSINVPDDLNLLNTV